MPGTQRTRCQSSREKQQRCCTSLELELFVKQRVAGGNGPRRLTDQETCGTRAVPLFLSRRPHWVTLSSTRTRTSAILPSIISTALKGTNPASRGR